MQKIPNEMCSRKLKKLTETRPDGIRPNKKTFSLLGSGRLHFDIFSYSKELFPSEIFPSKTNNRFLIKYLK